MPLPKLEDLCQRTPFCAPISRSLAFTHESPDGRFKMIHDYTGPDYEVRLNGKLIGTTPGSYYVVHGIWSTDSMLYSCLALKTTGEEVWCTFTFSAVEKRQIYRHKLGRIYATLGACSLNVKLLRMTPDGAVHGYEGHKPGYFAYHALKPSLVTHTPIPFFQNKFPECLTESPDGNVFAAYNEGMLLLSQEGHCWRPVARYDTREPNPYISGFSNDSKHLLLRILRNKELETWTLPLDRFFTKPAPTVPPHATRPMIL